VVIRAVQYTVSVIGEGQVIVEDLTIRVLWMKPEKFNGYGSFETFLVQLENCCRHNDWNRKDKAAHLRWSLAGAAAQTVVVGFRRPYV